MSGYKTQVGGNHYTKLKIQPMQYSMENGLNPLQHTIIKYVTRFRDKGGIDDLHKAKHCLDLLIEHEQYSAKTANWPESAELHIDVIGQNGEHYEQAKDVTEPLTADELKAGGWWCADISEECANALESKGLRVFNSSEWGNDERWGSCGLDDDGWFSRGFFVDGGNKEIHRIGSNFYWGAPE